MNLNPIAANMTEVKIKNLVVLFSYKTPVAVCNYAIIPGLPCYFQTNKKWSATTTRHINKWLNGHYAEVKPQEYFDNLVSEVKL